MEIDNPITQNFEGITKEDDKFAIECNKLSESVAAGNILLTDLVGDLGFYLVHEDPERRAYGTCILARVLEALPVDLLNETQLHFISSFYSDRLKDHHQVVPDVLKGILAAMRHKNLPNGVSATILSSLFHNVPCQQQQQGDRNNIYRIFQVMLDRKENELKAMNLDFVFGVLSAMDGERDPRNLLFLFRWLPRFLRSVNLGHLTEEMFEVMACYFPVDFRMPSQDSNGVSREALAEALGPCLCALPGFAEFTVPLALEKLGSTLRIAKLDSLDLLHKGCSVFPEETYLLHSSEMWPLMHKEVLSSDPELESECLKTMTAFITKISESNTDTFKQVLSNITDTLKGGLRPDQKMFPQTTKILLSVARGSTLSATHVVQSVLPSLTNLYNITDTVDHKVLVFEALIAFYKAYVDVSNTNDIQGIKDLALIPNLCLKTAVDDDLKLRAVGLLGLSVLTKTFSEQLRRLVYVNLKMYLVKPQQPKVRTALLTCFKAFAVDYVDEILDLIKSVTVGDNLESLETFLDSLCCICGMPDYTDTVLALVVAACVRNASTEPIGVRALLKIMQLEGDNPGVHRYLDKCGVVKLLVGHTISGISEIDRATIGDISELLKLVVGYQGSDEQRQTVISSVQDVVTSYKNSRNVTYFYILNGLVCRLRREVLQDFNIVEDLVDAALTCEDVNIQGTSIKLLANIVNKLEDDDQLLKYINDIEKKCDNSLTNDSSARLVANVNSITAWITKALVMRGHSLGSKWTKKLTERLEIYKVAAVGFKIVMNEDCDSLSLRSYCNKRLLYRQLFFITTCDLLMEKCNEENENYLLAIGYILEEVPMQILKMYFDKILRLLILCLDKCHDSNSLSAVLLTMKALIENQDDLAESHMMDFLPRLMHLTRFEPAMKVRITAIQCLALYTSGYPLYKLLPQKADVISALERCLDDHKRLVRRQAVEARLKWYLIDAPI